MKRSGLIALVLLASAVLQAQEKPAGSTPAQQSPAAPAGAGEPVYVRRVSLGITGSLPATMLLHDGDSGSISTSPALETFFQTTATKHFFGGGALVQFALLERWTLNLNGIVRTAQYEAHRNYAVGVDNSNTLADERTHTSTIEKTKARYIDVPMLLRRYNIGRHDYGHRWFIEAGPSLRHVAKIRTGWEKTDAKGNVTNTITPADHKANVIGATIGFGGQLIDPVGVRITPEVRYTRWLGRTFDAPPNRSWLDQFEALISISF